MFIHPLVDGPAILQIGAITVSFYALMSMLSYSIVDYLGEYRLKKNKFLTEDEWYELFNYLGISVVAGGRIGDILLYRMQYLIESPWVFVTNSATRYTTWLLLALISLDYLYSKFFTDTPFPKRFFIVPLLMLFLGGSGMSFHGALIAGMLAILGYCYRFKKNFLDIMDFIAPLIPPVLGLGRLANFFNGELWGRPTDRPWGVIFPRMDFQTRHPSQLYECFLEGILLFIILWHFSKRLRPKGAVFGLAISLYAVFRIFVEFFREPDALSGFIAWEWLTMGQLLSLPMLLGGVFILLKVYFFENQDDV